MREGEGGGVAQEAETFNVFDRCPRIRVPSVLHFSGASISIYTFRATIGACRCHRLYMDTSDVSLNFIPIFFSRQLLI